MQHELTSPDTYAAATAISALRQRPASQRNRPGYPGLVPQARPDDIAFQPGIELRSPDVPGQPRFGGQRKASLPGRGFDVINDYLGLFGTPAEQVVRDAWSPANRSTP